MGSPKKTLQYRYDARGNRRALVDQDGGRFTYSYDSVGRISQLLNPQGQPTTFSYDDGGRRTLKKLSNGTRTSFSYDAASNLTKLYHLKTDGTVLSSFDYAYDKVGNRTGVLEAGGSRVTWSYDNTYQLTGEHRTGTTPYRDTYTYDAAGNRLLKNHDGARTTYAYDNANQLRYSQELAGRTTFTFDADGNQQVQREPSGNRTTYSWDYENRMTLVRLPDATRATMAYEPEGLRVKVQEATGTKKFVWDEQNYLAETNATDDTQAVYTNEPRTYGRLISQRRSTTTHWYHFDAIGSTRHLTSSAAAVTDTRLFDAWGVSLASSGSTVFPFGYVGVDGYYTDVAGTRLYVRARYLRPIAGMWMTTDPLQSLTKDVSYRYANNRPQIFRDASGYAAPDDADGLCDFFSKSCAGTGYGGCCCSSFEVIFRPAEWQRRRYTDITMRVWVRSRYTYFGICPWYWWDTGWHEDDPGNEKGGRTDWNRNVRPGIPPSWEDYPGLNDKCFGLCLVTSVKQEWEVCAVGIRPVQYKEISGCVSYSHECEYIYSPGCPCKTSCFIQRTPGKRNIEGVPPLHPPGDPNEA